jgi:heme a synthase
VPRSEIHGVTPKVVRNWLVLVYGMILLMTMLGGITRLTGSGLSMVDWRPLMGALPPLSEAEWNLVFEEYQRSPQYVDRNYWMALADFKKIFFWEYIHRLCGRLIGLVFVGPWMFFVGKGLIRGRLTMLTFLILVLGGGQGLMGWYMVKSGLINAPEVSHYRLAAHLLLACALAMWVLWLILQTSVVRTVPRKVASTATSWCLLVLIGAMVIQIGYGALMAGTKAGYYFQTFPTMNGRWMPHNVLDGNFLDNPVAIHFTHRCLAWAISSFVAIIVLFRYKYSYTSRQKFSLLLLVVMVFVQFLLGVATVLLSIPIPIAVAHQVCGLLLISAAVFSLHAHVCPT